ncbi:ZIP family metal transporter [Pseudomaricurvus albidus]|uniref:ZIP family metal transporter n=1 Tax=Pseudomaricurvus albidus TaxID=2842452 RepID=UPI0027146F55|nr:divalent cation transporter [Aestuariicella albida]
MSELQGVWTVIVLTLIAGLAMPAGALLAQIERIQPQWLEEELRHTVTAFGGGALFSAVALVLVTDGVEHLSVIHAVSMLVVGGLAFMGLDIWLYKVNTPATQLAAMLSDFIPESLALGAALAFGKDTAFLLAALITLQNLPEGFNAYRELCRRLPAGRIIFLFALMAALGPVAGVTGYVWLVEEHQLLASIMLFAAGGILYSVFQDIAPQVKLEKHWWPPMGAVLGFGLGLVGYMLTA